VRPLSRHAALAGLGALGSLVVHQLAYLLAFPSAAARAEALGHHDHLGPQWAVVTPLAVMAAAVFVLHQVRQLGLVGPTSPVGTGTVSTSGRRLALVILGLFVGQELLESLVLHPHGAAPWANPALFAGALLAPLVALAMDRFLGAASRVTARWLDRRPQLVTASAMVGPVPPPIRWVAPLLGRPAPRGPPAVVRFRTT
jgi:hypothetical protein